MSDSTVHTESIPIQEDRFSPISQKSGKSRRLGLVGSGRADALHHKPIMLCFLFFTIIAVLGALQTTGAAAARRVSSFTSGLHEVTASICDEMGCFGAVATPLTWMEHFANCKSLGGELVHVKSLGVNTIVQELGVNVSEDFVWVGLQDEICEGEPYWSSPTGISKISRDSYVNWKNSRHVPNSRRNCATLRASSGEWQYQRCQESFPAICALFAQETALNQSCTSGQCKSCSGDVCYHFVRKRLDYRRARDYCKTRFDGILAGIGSAKEQREVSSLLLKVKDHHKVRRVRLGLRKDGGGRGWVNEESAEELSFSNWRDGEGSKRGSCAAMRATCAGHGKWQAYSCKVRQSFLCKSSQNTQPDAFRYYSKTLTEANSKFVRACSSAQSELKEYAHPEVGDNGEPLKAYTCYQRRKNPENIIVTISGTHGVEGYAGSAMQIGLLEDKHQNLSIPDNFDVLHVHMINPYGASFILKEDEQNADQYKNYAALYKENITNPLLVEFNDALNISQLGTESGQNAARQVFEGVIRKYGPEKFGEFSVLGQGARPQGIAYWGAKESWGTQRLQEICNLYLTDAKHLLVIDWHTAVGPYGTWTVLGIDESEGVFANWLRGTTNVTVMASSVPTGSSPGFEFLRKGVDTKIVRGVIEAGTYSDAEFVSSFATNLYCRFYEGGWKSEICAFTRERILEFFYPQSPSWKLETWKNFQFLWPRLVAGMTMMTSNATRAGKH